MTHQIEPEKIAARFDERPGFSLVDFREVGLPVYRITATALMQAQKKYPPIEEFVLRAVDVGFSRPDEVAGFLGLSNQIVEATLTNLIRSNDIYEKSDCTVALTQKGLTAVREEAYLKPSDQMIIFHYLSIITII